jgi:hypothetical protein
MAQMTLREPTPVVPERQAPDWVPVALRNFLDDPNHGAWSRTCPGAGLLAACRHPGEFHPRGL